MEIFEILPGLYQSSAYSEKDIEKLKQLKINIIIDLEGGFDIELDFLTSYVYWPIKDEEKLPDLAQLDAIASYAHLSRNGNSNILVHCYAGVNRASLINCIILHKAGWSGKNAIKLIREKRPGALTNQTFVNYIKGLI